MADILSLLYKQTFLLRADMNFLKPRALLKKSYADASAKSILLTLLGSLATLYNIANSKIDIVFFQYPVAGVANHVTHKHKCPEIDIIACPRFANIPVRSCFSYSFKYD
jgi:hypothetical protein